MGSGYTSLPAEMEANEGSWARNKAGRSAETVMVVAEAMKKRMEAMKAFMVNRFCFVSKVGWLKSCFADFAKTGIVRRK